MMTYAFLMDPQITAMRKLPYHVPNDPGTSTLVLSDEAWDFQYYTSVDDIPDAALSGDGDGWSPMPVPSNWQLHGFGQPKYINTRYTFEKDSMALHPPVIDAKLNAAGVYRCFFSFGQHAGNRTILSFEGAESGLIVYLNGQFAGYSSNGRSAADFDVTDFLISGTNVLTAVVTSYTAGSWMECQDMWRLCGIIRPVRLYEVPEIYLSDYYAYCTLEQDYTYGTLYLECKIRNASAHVCDPVSVRMSLFDAEGACLGTACGTTEDHSHRYHEEDLFTLWGVRTPLQAGCLGTAYLKLSLSHPALWSAEVPYLYTVRLELLDQEQCTETLTFPFGFREIRRQGCRLLVNGKEQIFRGVNCHEFSPAGGHVVTEEEMLKDILLMKQNNINAVRCSHYPHADKWYTLCDRYGLYCMDEADVETHGISYRRNVLPGNDPLWLPMMLDRIQSLVQCDKNHPSILFWSLGNELGYGEDVATAAAYIRAVDPTRLIHNRQMHAVADMDSETYASPADLLARAKQYPDRPYLLNEYAHAMGNAMGSLSEYWNLFRTIPQLAGGFIWEWCDHGLYDPSGETLRFCYGGDFGEDFHDGNFCIDGVVTPDRKQTPKLEEVKQTHACVSVRREEDSSEVLPHVLTLLVANEYSFLDLSFLTWHFDLLRNGQPVWSDKDRIIDLAPSSRAQVRLQLPGQITDHPLHGEYVLNARACYCKDTPFCKAGYEAYGTSIILGRISGKEVFRPASDPMTLMQKEGMISIISDRMVLNLDQSSGFLVRYSAHGYDLLSDLRPVFFRAPTDNDRHSSYLLDDKNWYTCGLAQEVFKLTDLTVHQKSDHVEIQSHHKLQDAPGDLNVQLTYRIYADGRIILTCGALIDKAFPILGRFGLRFHADDALKSCMWYGFGQETYRDREAAGRLAIYTTKVADENCRFYIRPQEYGDHAQTRAIALYSETGYGLTVRGNHPYSMKAVPWTSGILADCAHNDALPDSSSVWLYVDFLQTGLGNGSCGPQVFPKDQLTAGRYRFSLQLDPTQKPELFPSPLFPFPEDINDPLPGQTRDRLFFRYRDPSDPKIRKMLGYHV